METHIKILGVFYIVYHAIGLVVGLSVFGLLKRWSWARILVMIVAAFTLLEFPLGTALGAYTFWVLLQDDTSRIFRARHAAA